MLSGTVSLNPGVGPKVESSFVDELKNVYEKGFTAAEVEGAKKALLDARMVDRSTDGALLNLMVSHEQLNRPLQVGRRSRGEDRGAHRRPGQRRVPQAHRSGVSIVKAGDFKAAGVYK